MSAAGLIRFRGSQVTIQQQSATPDGAGGFTSQWTTFATVYALVAVTGGGEQLEGGQDPPRRLFDVTILTVDGLTSAMRVCWGSVVMAITLIKAANNRPFLVLACVEQPGVAP
jgi:head-tail adaptor